MERNDELRTAWEFVEHTGKSIFLTGKAGTGKTTFLRAVKEHSHKRMVVVAPTGVAAINARGATIHSFFQLPLSPYVPGARLDSKFTYSKDKRKIMRTIDMLVIDEISMVRCDVLDAIDSVMRRFREHDKPFGGVQLVMIGDLQQLTPVVRSGEDQILAQYYDTPYFFGSHALKNVDYVTIELHHVFRQNDTEFLSILNDIRDGRATALDLRRLNSRYNPAFRPKPEEGYIRLTTHNRIADNCNNREIDMLPGRPFSFNAEVEGDFPEYDFPTDRRLTLKEGAQVMFLKNDSEGRYYNGRIGRVTHVGDDGILVLCPGDENAIKVEPETWENTKYKLNELTRQIEADVVGKFKQYPLRLAWAITIHKSQGLTFDHAIIDAQLSFSAGQVYVALSRCRTLEGLVLATPISPQAIINDPRVATYIARQGDEARESIARLDNLKEEYYRQLLQELFNLHAVTTAEGMLDRVMQEHFFGKTELAELHHEAYTRMQTQLEPMAAKWMTIISSTPTDQIHGPEFLERVKRGAGYFASQLDEIFGELMERTKRLKIGNKIILKRFDRVFADIHDIWLGKKLLLDSIADEGFTPQSYLRSKQEAALAAMGDGQPGTAKKRATRKAAANAKPKAAKAAAEADKPAKPKVDTYAASLELYKQGKTIEMIANERNLKEETIYGHLLRYALRGELPIDELLPQEHRQTIMRAIKMAGGEIETKVIKQLCPPEITYAEIRATLELMKKNQKK